MLSWASPAASPSINRLVFVAFIKAGAKVRVVMTEAAKAFVTPLTFQTLTGSPVYDQLFIGSERFSVEHVGLAQEADLIVIARLQLTPSVKSPMGSQIIC